MPAFSDSDTDPDEALPPSEVRLTELRVEPWPDGRRVRVHLALTPFQQNPNLIAVIQEMEQRPIASTTIIETPDDRIVLTMHLRSAAAGVPYQLTVSVIYPDFGVVDDRTLTFEVSPTAGEEL